MSIRAEDQSGQATSAAGKKPEERRVFICYPRSTLRDVGAFHDALKERLQNLHRDYKIFRDKGRDEGENIVPGSEWKKRLHQTLDDSRCCLIVLVPAIFESSECADEVEYFQNKLENDGRRFFYPIVFIPLTGDESIETQAKSGNRIATAIKDLHHDEFLLSWTDSATSGYQARVNEIANAIHRQFSTKVPGKAAGLADLGVRGEVATTQEEGGWNFLRWALGLAAALTICALLVFFWLFPRPTTEPVFTSVSTPIELVVSTQSFASPSDDAAKLDPLGPLLLEAGKNDVVSIAEGQADGRAWYVVEFTNGEKHYFPKDSIPEWQVADSALEIIRPIKSRAQPLKDAAETAILAPGDFMQLRQYGEVRLAPVNGETWFRVPQKDGADVFFSESENRNKLAAWTLFESCLKAKANVWSKQNPVDGDSFNSFVKDQFIGKEYNIHSAEIDGQEWYRLVEGSDSAFGYLPATDVEPTACGGI